MVTVLRASAQSYRESVNGDSVTGFHGLQESHVVITVLRAFTHSYRESVNGDSVTGFHGTLESQVTV
jgi:hypothetical protein